MKGWLKWLLIIAIVIVCTIFFGTIVLYLGSYLVSFMSTILSWLAKAMQWLAKVFDLFGFSGIFVANADTPVVMYNIISTTKLL